MVSYNKLWKLLIDKNKTKKQLSGDAGLSSSTMAKLKKGDNLTTDVLGRICNALDCDFGDIMEYIKKE